MTSNLRHTTVAKSAAWKFLALALAVVIGSLLLTTMAVAHPDKECGERRGPPPEALDACQNLNIGNACSFTGRHDDTVTGLCVETPDQQIACKPEGHRPPRHRGGHDSHREHDHEMIDEPEASSPN